MTTDRISEAAGREAAAVRAQLGQDVAEAVDSDPALLDDIRLYLDVDRIASPNGVVGVYDLDESASRMPAEVSAEARAAEHLITERLDAQKRNLPSP